MTERAWCRSHYYWMSLAYAADRFSDGARKKSSRARAKRAGLLPVGEATFEDLEPAEEEQEEVDERLRRDAERGFIPIDLEDMEP